MKDLNVHKNNAHKQNTNNLNLSLIPHQEKYSEEKIEDILKDLKNNSSKELSKHLFRLISSKYPVPDITRLDIILKPLFPLLNEEMVDNLCIIILKSINCNLEFFMHKMNIYEKQGIKSNRKYLNINETNINKDVSMPNFKKVLKVFLKRERLSPKMKSIRPFIIYFILKDKLEINLSFEDIYKQCLEGVNSFKEGYICKEKESSLEEEDNVFKKNGSFYEEKVGNLHKKDNLGKFNSIHKKSIKELDSISSNFSYDGPYEVFYFLQYLLSGNVNVLKEWCLLSLKKEESFNENEELEYLNNVSTLSIFVHNSFWSLLNLPPMPFFLLNELKYVKDISILYSIILQCKSHFILSKFLFKILHKLNFSRSFHILVLSSFHPKKIKDSLLLLKRLYKENYHKTNRVLRDLIVGFKPKGLEDLFFTSYLNLDLNYFECLKIYLKKIHLIPKEKLKSILESEYFYILIEREEDFYLVLNLLNDNNLLDLTLKIIKKYKWTPTYGNIEKIKFLYKNYKIEKSLFVNEIKLMILKLSSIIIGGKFEDEDVCLYKRDCESSKNFLNENCINQDYNEKIMIKECSKGKKISQEKFTNSTIFSLISDVSTIEDISKIDFYEKKFKIKKVKKDFNSENNKILIKNLIDLIFIFRDETLKKSYLKKIYRLDPNHYLKNLKDNNFYEDVFFSRALRIALKKSKSKDEMIFWISEMPFYKKYDYWSMALKKSIGLEEEKGYPSKSSTIKNITTEEIIIPTLIHTPTKEIITPNLNTFYSNSTLRDSYLDLSQFNEGKLIVESKKEIENILKNCKTLSNSFLPISGIVMKKSSISISHRLNKFILVFKAYQLDLEGIQILLEMKGREKSVKIGFINGKLFQETIKDNLKERKFIENDLKKERNDFIYLELISNGTTLKMNVNTKVYNIPFFKVDLISFGGLDRVSMGRDMLKESKDKNNKESFRNESFKGLINKILLIEGCDYKNCRIVNLEGSYLYVKVLSKLERYLKYHNLFGVYLDSKTPYFFNKKVPIEFRNVLKNGV